MPRWGLLPLLILLAGCATGTPVGLRFAGSSLPHRIQDARGPITRDGPGDAAGAVSGAVPHRAPESAALMSRQAVRGAVADVRGTLERIAVALPRLEAHDAGLGKVNGIFLRYADHGSRQLPWMNGALVSVTTLTTVAGQLQEPDMELALVRMSGPRLQAALFGSLLLSGWLDFLTLTDAVLQHCPYYSIEVLLRDVDRAWRLLEPSLAALASLEPGAVETMSLALPGLMEQLSREFDGLRARVQRAAEVTGKALAVKEFIEMLCTLSTMRLALPGPPPSAPAVLGAGLVMGNGGVMMGSQVVVSAEWVEMMHRLVQAGVLSAATVNAAVRIQAGGMLMAQANQDLPPGVREALGEGPEVDAMHETDRAGAGMNRPPRHHVMPQEHREWFEKRGFTGDMDIDQFCVEMEQAHHEAIHGGGDWRLGRTWPGEWNQMIMEALRDAETAAGRMLSRDEVLDIVAKKMRDSGVPMNFVPGRGR